MSALVKRHLANVIHRVEDLDHRWPSRRFEFKIAKRRLVRIFLILFGCWLISGCYPIVLETFLSVVLILVGFSLGNFWAKYKTEIKIVGTDMSPRQESSTAVKPQNGRVVSADNVAVANAPSSNQVVGLTEDGSTTGKGEFNLSNKDGIDRSGKGKLQDAVKSAKEKEARERAAKEKAEEEAEDKKYINLSFKIGELALGLKEGRVRMVKAPEGYEMCSVKIPRTRLWKPRHITLPLLVEMFTPDYPLPGHKIVDSLMKLGFVKQAVDTVLTIHKFLTKIFLLNLFYLGWLYFWVFCAKFWIGYFHFFYWMFNEIVDYTDNNCRFEFYLNYLNYKY